MPYQKFKFQEELTPSKPKPPEEAFQGLWDLAKALAPRLDELGVGKVGIYVNGERVRVLPWAGARALEAHAKFFGLPSLTPEAVLATVLEKAVDHLWGETSAPLVPGVLEVRVRVDGKWTRLASWPS